MHDEPRQHHYVFAHRVLPQLVLEQWEVLRPSFQDGSATERLRSMWQGVGHRLAPSERFDAEGSIHVREVKTGNGHGFLISFPSPQFPAEAGLALIPDLPSRTRYFVLELGWDVVERHQYWVLCEWDETGHVNLGRCGEEHGGDPELVRDQMLDRVSEVLAREDNPRA
jgi:hypothetical protein